MVLGVILARAGSKGLPGKCMRPLLGRPLIEYTFDHALAARRLAGLVFSTDSAPARAAAEARSIPVIERPAELATDAARVDDAARHAVLNWEKFHGRRVDAVVLLYGNIPVRAPGVIDRAIEQLQQTGADSVRTVAPVGKTHPDWLHRLDGDRMTAFRPNGIYRRQDLEPLYYHDGAVLAVTRRALFAATDNPADGQAFLGKDRRALLQSPADAVDVDELADLFLAEAVLRSRAAISPDGPQAPTSAGRGNDRHAGIRIGARCLGGRQPVYIVAEAGVNHDGDVDKALALADAAADAGADAVKFQMFRAAELATDTARQAAYQQQQAPDASASQRLMLEALELPHEAWTRLRDHCQLRGIEFFATPFGLSDVDRLAALGVRAIKIASTDINNVPLLDAALCTGLPLILSTGASTAPDIDAAVDRIRRGGGFDRLILLHCVSCYPTPLESANLRRIRALRERYGVHVGFSDHTLSTWTGSWAAAMGAAVLEKHLTLDRCAPGPDHAMSLCPAKFREYVARVREMHTALGDGAIDLTEAETEVRSLARRSIVAARDLPAGAVLTPSALTVKRPAGGLSPADFERLIDRRLRVPVRADAQLSWDMLE